jgi:predicted PurR-regulated permease PerM
MGAVDPAAARTHIRMSMPPPDPPAPVEPTANEKRVLLGLLGLATVALLWVLLPYYGTILWGIVIALLFAPLNRRLIQRLNLRRTIAALLTLLLVVVIVILPLSLVTVALAQEASAVYQQLESGALNPLQYLRGVFDALPRGVTAWLDRFGLVDFNTLERRLTAALAQASQLIAKQALGIGQNTFEFVVELFVTLYLAFFLLRDGPGLARALRTALPLAPAQCNELIGTFSVVVRATVKGNLLIAALQGLLGGLAFWWLGVHGALLWAVAMALLSLLPAVGAALVWVPVAVSLMLTGALWQGVALTAWGVLVIGLVDNLLRPILVGKDTRLPDFVVLLTTLGGLTVFGVNGFVLGPAIAAMFVAVWHLYSATRRHAGS